MSKPGLSLVKPFSLDKGAGHISLDLGATLLFPDELSLTAEDGAPRASVYEAVVHSGWLRCDAAAHER